MNHSEEDDPEPLSEESLETVIISECDRNCTNECRNSSMEDRCSKFRKGPYNFTSSSLKISGTVRRSN